MKATGSGLLVRHSPASFMIGNIGATLFRGADEVNSSQKELEEAVREFNAVLLHYGHQIGFKTFAHVKGILTLNQGS